MSEFCQPAGAEQAEGIELSLSAKGPGSVQQSPTIAGRSEAPLRKQVSLKARYYQSAESGSAPALLELEREGHSLAGTESQSESLWRGQIQPVSAGSALLPEIREAAVSQESTQSGASPKHHGIFWQQMQRDANQLSGSQVKVLPSLREATADAQDRHAEAAASRSSTGLTLPKAAAALLNDQASVGLLLYAVSTIFAAGMNTCAKLLSKGGMPVFEILLVRSFLMTGAAGGAIVQTRISPWGTRRKLLVVRGLLGFLSISGVYWSLKLLPLSDATVLQFIAPLFVTVLAPLILHENPSRMDIAAIPICMAGVLLIAKPSFLFGQHTDRHISHVGIIIGVAQAFFSAAVKVVLRILGKTESTHVMMFYMGGESFLLSVILCAAIPNMFRLPKSGFEVVLLVFTGGFGYGSQATMTMALKRVKATAAMALSFIQMVWALILGFLVFSEVPSTTSLIGATLICGCTCLLSVASQMQTFCQPKSWHWLPDCWHSVSNGIASACSRCWHGFRSIGRSRSAEGLSSSPRAGRSRASYERFPGDEEEPPGDVELERQRPPS